MPVPTFFFFVCFLKPPLDFLLCHFCWRRRKVSILFTPMETYCHIPSCLVRAILDLCRWKSPSRARSCCNGPSNAVQLSRTPKHFRNRARSWAEPIASLGNTSLRWELPCDRHEPLHVSISDATVLSDWIPLSDFSKCAKAAFLPAVAESVTVTRWCRQLVAHQKWFSGE